VSTVERGVVDEPVEERRSVSGHAASLRAATGFGVWSVLITVSALVWREVLDLALGFLLLGSIWWLHKSDDAHSRAAAVVGGGVSLLVGFGAAAIWRQPEADFSRDVAFAALGVLAGSQAYAAVTRRRL
jgi:hypothetical protein